MTWADFYLVCFVVGSFSQRADVPRRWHALAHSRIFMDTRCLLTFMAQHTRPQHTGDTTFSSRPSI